MLALVVVAAPPPAEIARFNHALEEATRSMKNAAVLALWEDDGVSLLPGQAPLVGKKALGRFFDDVTAKMPGGKMVSFELQCNDVRVEGRTATEWCSEHQVVHFADGKPPFDGHGNMLLVLHKGDDGVWRIRDEMWNAGERPQK